MIDTLINKQDTAEIVRDQIAAILALEVQNQMALAVTALLDPEPWRLRIFSERSNPWEAFPPALADVAPIVNVRWDDSNFDLATSNIAERQKTTAIFNIDCYGYGQAEDVQGGGHTPGDRNAALEAHRAVRLVRNILMAATYTYLELQGTVWRRFIGGITLFEPQQDNQNAVQVVGARLAFRVEFNEYSPQVTPDELDLLTARISRSVDDEIIIEADYDYTA